jgi:hypothetical protein
MGSTPWTPRPATCSVHRCRPSTEAHGACRDQLTTPPREPLGPTWPASAAPASLLAADRDSRRQHHPPKQQQQHDGHRPERKAPADLLANRDMSRNGLGFAVSLRQGPPGWSIWKVPMARPE